MSSEAEAGRPSDSKLFSIRGYVAEVRKRDWRKCFPFNLSGDFEESNFKVYGKILASLLQEDNNSLLNTPEDAEAPNCFTASQVRNSEVQEAGSETLTGITCQDTVIGNEAANTINDGSTPRRVKDGRCQNEKFVTEDAIVVENDTRDLVSKDDSANTINDRPSESNCSKSNYAKCQNEMISFANDAVAAEIDKPHSTLAVNTFSDGPSESASNTINDDPQSQNGKRTSADAIASGNDKPNYRVFDTDAANSINDGPSVSAAIGVKDGRYQNEKHITEVAMAGKNDKRQRYLVRRKPQKFRLLSDIYKELDDERKYNIQTEEDSDGVTLDALIRKKKRVRMTSKSRGELKSKRKIPQGMEPRLQAKRSKSVCDDIHGNDKLDLQMTNKLQKFPAEIRCPSSHIMHDNQGAPSSLGGQENTFRTWKDSFLSCGYKSKREYFQEGCAREALKLLDGSQRHFTEEENHSSPVAESAQLVQPATTISKKDTETAYGFIHKRIRESSPPSDNESMQLAALQLLRLSDAGVNTKTSSKTATEDPAILSLRPKHKSSSGLVGVVQPASGFMVSKPHVEVKMMNGATLPEAEHTKCPMNRNPAEFSIPYAKKFMRRGK